MYVPESRESREAKYMVLCKRAGFLRKQNENHRAIIIKLTGERVRAEIKS